MSHFKSSLDPDWDGRPDFPEVIDNSMISQFKHCEGKFWYGFLENLSSAGTSVHLHAGGAFAEGVETVRRAYYVDGLEADEALALGVCALIRYFGDYDAPVDSPKSCLRMAGALVYYFDTHGLATDIIKPWNDGANPGIEFSFVLPLPVSHPQTGLPILYSGRFDMLGQHKDGMLLIVDEKTASQLGGQWANQWRLDSQFTGYCYGARHYGKPVVGALIRGVSILKTKYDHAEAYIYRGQWELDRWLEQTVRKVERMKEIWQQGKASVDWKLDKFACGSYGGCEFAQLCSSPNPERWMPINFEPRVWHPQLRDERKQQLTDGSAG